MPIWLKRIRSRLFDQMGSDDLDNLVQGRAFLDTVLSAVGSLSGPPRQAA